MLTPEDVREREIAATMWKVEEYSGSCNITFRRFSLSDRRVTFITAGSSRRYCMA